MPTLTLTLELDDEQQDALADFTAEWNGPNGTSTIAQRVIEDAVLPFVRSKVEGAYTAAVAKLGQDAKGLPYATRKALIAQVREQLAGG